LIRQDTLERRDESSSRRNGQDRGADISHRGAVQAAAAKRREESHKGYRPFTARDLGDIPEIRDLPPSERFALDVVSAVLPFRANNYVVEELIDWAAIPDDPIYQLTFPQAGMLSERDFRRVADVLRSGASDEVRDRVIGDVRAGLNPHPAGQMELNVPELDGEPVQGMQHKYRETVLFFPSQGQTCHAYCTYCFRWAQFVGLDELKFANREVDLLVRYLKRHPEVTDVLFTGGDTLVMKTEVLRRYIDPLLQPGLEHVRNIRIGTKSTAYWPYRFLTDPDADDLLRLLERVTRSGKHLSLMSHYSHPRELEPKVARKALRRIRDTGAVVRCQAPVIRHVNDSAETWAQLWRQQVRLGAVPYYMFLTRDTGSRAYFEVPLARAHRIFWDAYRQVSGLARTVRGPSMSTSHGKVLVDGITDLGGMKAFALKFLQARDPDWVGRPFFAEFDPKATWLDQLRPAFGEDAFFFEVPDAQTARGPSSN
jgi:KamA family protein